MTFSKPLWVLKTEIGNFYFGFFVKKEKMEDSKKEQKGKGGRQQCPINLTWGHQIEWSGCKTLIVLNFKVELSHFSTIKNL